MTENTSAVESDVAPLPDSVEEVEVAHDGGPDTPVEELTGDTDVDGPEDVGRPEELV